MAGLKEERGMGRGVHFTLNMRQSHMNFITNEKVAKTARPESKAERGGRGMRSTKRGAGESTQRMINEARRGLLKG